MVGDIETAHVAQTDRKPSVNRGSFYKNRLTAVMQAILVTLQCKNRRLTVVKLPVNRINNRLIEGEPTVCLV